MCASAKLESEAVIILEPFLGKESWQDQFLSTAEINQCKLGWAEIDVVKICSVYIKGSVEGILEWRNHWESWEILLARSL